MLGELVWTMCGNHLSDRRRFFELWSYPDGTLNFVTSECELMGIPELHFPCMIEQLERALDARPVTLRDSQHVLTLRGRDDCVCGELCTHAGQKLWDQCMDRGEYHEMLASLNGLALGIA